MNRKDEFIQRWKELEGKCDEIFAAPSGSPMDELFTRYMYFERAKLGIKQTTTEALRKFYERDKYAILKREETLQNLEELAEFWRCVSIQDDSVFSDRVLKKLSILNNAPNGMWTYLVSVYYLKNRQENGHLAEMEFYNFLDRIIAFIWAYAVIRPGVNALRTPTYPAMIDIVNGNEVTFADFRFDADQVRKMFENYEFTNQRPITKSLLAWWAYTDDAQALIPADKTLEIEHIFSRQRQINERSLLDGSNLESIGNKSLLEKGINIRASDYRFEDKKKYYMGFTNDKGKIKEPTIISELKGMAQSREDFQEKDIVNRKNLILDTFIEYLRENNLILS